MKIIEAIWEKRNLGVTTQEVTIEITDNISDLLKLKALLSEYQVVKLPIDRADFIFQIQNIGFNFAEIIYESQHNLSEPILYGPINRLKDNFCYARVELADIDRIKTRILDGIFRTDRVALDPNFGVLDAGKRYVGWLADEIDSGSYVFELRYKNNSYAFFVMSVKEKVCYGRIGGVYLNTKGFGLGILLNYYEIVVARELGCTSLTTSFSSNNNPIYLINEMLGYKTRPTFNIFVRHNRQPLKSPCQI